MDVELERLYSPSKWSKRFQDPDELIAHFTKITTEDSEKARGNIPNERNLRYGPKERELYDIYGTNLPDDAKILVFIHGGYWQDLDKNCSSYAALSMVNAGIKLIVLGYTLAPQATMEEIIAEISSGLHVISKNYSKSKGIWVAGHSAGAHLAAMNLLCNPMQTSFYIFRGIIFISGIFHLVPLIKTYINKPLLLNKDSAIKLSPLALLSEMTFTAAIKRLKILITVGEFDSPAFIQQSKELYQLLHGRVSETEYIELKNQDHFSIVENLSSENFELSKRIINAIKSL